MLFLYQGGQMTTYSYNDILEILFVNTFINQKVLKSKKEKSFYTYFDDYYNHLSIKHIDINEKEIMYKEILSSLSAINQLSIVIDYLVNNNKNITDQALSSLTDKIKIIQNTRNFSNKQILSRIGNALRHTKATKVLFSIEKGRVYNIEIDDKNLIVNFTYKQLLELLNLLSEKSRNQYYFDIEGFEKYNFTDSIDDIVNDIYMQFYPLRNTFPKETVDNIYNSRELDRSNEQIVIQKSNEIKEILRQELNNENKSIRDYQYPLDEIQKQTVKAIISKYKRSNLPLPFDDSSFFAYITFVTKQVIPSPLRHLERLQVFSTFFDKDLSLEMTYSSYRRKLEKDIENSISYLDYISYCNKFYYSNIPVDTRNILQKNYHYLLSTKELRYVYSLIEFIRFYICFIDSSNTFIIDGKKYEVARLRNSLIHFRWFLGIDNTLHYFDTDTRHFNMYEFSFQEGINLDSLYKYCESKYLSNKGLIHKVRYFFLQFHQ